MTAGLDRTSVPTTTHCDHLIQARVDGKTDLMVAADTNRRSTTSSKRSVSARVRRGLLGSRARASSIRSCSSNYAFPGGMMLGTDSHTPNAGGSWHDRRRRGRRRRRRRDDRLRRGTCAGPRLIGVTADRFELGGWAAPEGRHPEGGRDPDGEGRHGRDRRILRPRRRTASVGNRQGNHLQHGRRDRRHHVAVRLRRRGRPAT